MTDTQIPAWHTTGTDTTTGRVDEMRSALAELRDKYAQAVDAQETAETAQRRAEEKAQREADRADGAESFLHQVLDWYVIDPAIDDAGIDAGELLAEDREAIADALIDDMKTGTDVEDLSPTRHLRDWEADRG